MHVLKMDINRIINRFVRLVRDPVYISCTWPIMLYRRYNHMNQLFPFCFYQSIMV